MSFYSTTDEFPVGAGVGIGLGVCAFLFIHVPLRAIEVLCVVVVALLFSIYFGYYRRRRIQQANMAFINQQQWNNNQQQWNITQQGHPQGPQGPFQQGGYASQYPPQPPYAQQSPYQHPGYENAQPYAPVSLAMLLSICRTNQPHMFSLLAPCLRLTWLASRHHLLAMMCRLRARRRGPIVESALARVPCHRQPTCDGLPAWTSDTHLYLYCICAILYDCLYIVHIPVGDPADS